MTKEEFTYYLKIKDDNIYEFIAQLKEKVKNKLLLWDETSITCIYLL